MEIPNVKPLRINKEVKTIPGVKKTLEKPLEAKKASIFPFEDMVKKSKEAGIIFGGPKINPIIPQVARAGTSAIAYADSRAKGDDPTVSWLKAGAGFAGGHVIGKTIATSKALHEASQTGAKLKNTMAQTQNASREVLKNVGTRKAKIKSYLAGEQSYFHAPGETIGETIQNKIRGGSAYVKEVAGLASGKDYVSSSKGFKDYSASLAPHIDKAKKDLVVSSQYNLAAKKYHAKTNKSPEALLSRLQAKGFDINESNAARLLENPPKKWFGRWGNY